MMENEIRVARAAGIVAKDEAKGIDDKHENEWKQGVVEYRTHTE